MTVHAPAAAKAAGLGARLFDGVTLKTILTAAVCLTTWHQVDAGEIKVLRQQNTDQEHRLDKQSEILAKKVNEADYDRDVRNIADSLNRIQLSIEGIHHTLEERPH